MIGGKDVANASDVKTGESLLPGWVEQVIGPASGDGVRLGVIDSGWDRRIRHPRVVPGMGFVKADAELALSSTSDDHDRIGHGTACIDLALRMAPDVQVTPLRVFGRRLETTPEILCEAIRVGMSLGLDVINVSLGTTRQDARKDLERVCAEAHHGGHIIVAAAGPGSMPATLPNVLGVGSFEPPNPWVIHYNQFRFPHYAALGRYQDLLLTSGRRVHADGTSFAAPIVSALVALILENARNATLDDIQSVLQTLASAAPDCGKR